MVLGVSSKPGDSHRGFTLIELLVTITIIGVLAAIGLVVYSGITKEAKISATKEQLRRLKQAMQAYKVKNGELPPPGDSCPACAGTETERATTLRNGLLASLVDPSTGGPFIQNPEKFVYDAWGMPLLYDDNDYIGGANPCQGGLTNTSAVWSAGPDKNRVSEGDNISVTILCP